MRCGIPNPQSLTIERFLESVMNFMGNEPLKGQNDAA
jgi:hypothetical protein